MRCRSKGCDNYANPLRKHYCNACGSQLGIPVPPKPEYHVPEEVQALCAANDVDTDRRRWTFVGDTELPSPFTKIVDRKPVVGDCVVTKVPVGSWLDNSFGWIIGLEDGGASIIMGSYKSNELPVRLPYDNFVVCEK
eukprot:CAMPEP_0113881700 /NCGR_PEP_ID=MMETSP0780_2-20120614/8527_1 /TAXON_ID=652834 /ORGANISM="Palpitomonas bilix" /LENGTH=136 /DNA_ID=CAMNT_0000868597 /DNA_START=161 /DNA_END=571 /DNA_ORIENTATION=+ /assembly_acc=CAM_ASM_000599